MIAPTKEFFTRLKSCIDALNGKDAVYIPKKPLTPKEAGFNGGQLPLSATPILEADAFRRRWLSHVRFFQQVLSVVQIKVERPLQVIEDLPAGHGKLVCTSLKTLVNAVCAALGLSEQTERRAFAYQGTQFNPQQYSDIMFDDPNLPVKPLMAEALASIFLAKQAERAGYNVTFTVDPHGSQAFRFNTLHLAVRMIGVARCMFNKSTPIQNAAMVLRPVSHPLYVEHLEYSKELMAFYLKAGMRNQTNPVWTPFTVATATLAAQCKQMVEHPNSPSNWFAMRLWPGEDYHEAGPILREWFVGFDGYRTLRTLERASVPPGLIKRPSFGDGKELMAFYPKAGMRNQTPVWTPFKDLPPFQGGIVGCYCPRCASIDEYQAILPCIPDDAVKGGPQFLESHVGTITDMPGVYGADFCDTLGIMKKAIDPTRMLAMHRNQILTNLSEVFA